MKKNSRAPRRVLFFLLKLFLLAVLLTAATVVFAVTHLKSILLDLVRSNYPDIIIHVEKVEYAFPLGFRAKGVYLRHIDDTSATSAVTIPELSIKMRYSRAERFTVEDISLVGFAMTIDNSQPASVLPFQAFVSAQTIRDEESRESKTLFGRAVLTNGNLSIVGENYDVSMRVNMNLSRGVKAGEGYAVSCSLKKFLVISYDFRTKPLEIEFDARLPNLDFSKVVPVEEARFVVNDVPATARGKIESVESGYRVEADVQLARRPLRDLLELVEYKVPVVGEFDIDAPADVAVQVIYDPDIEEFIRVTGKANIDEGTAISEEYGVELSGLRALFPFGYRASASAYSWRVGGSMPGYGEGRMTAGTVSYDRYKVSDFSSMFSTDGMTTRFENIALEGYRGRFQGNIDIAIGGEKAETALFFNVVGLDMSQLLAVFEQKTFNMGGIANGTIDIKLTDNYIENIAVRLTTEDGIFAIKDIGESLSALPGGDAVTGQLRKKMGKKEYWDAFVKAMRRYPYDEGRIDVSWDPRDKGLVLLDLWLKGKKPEEGTKIFFPTVPITIGYHGINSITDLFNIDQVLRNLGKSN
jgi:hypothetical protein